MLKNISPLISPDLLKILMEMGHGDELVLADANFPGHRIGSKVVRADGIGINELLDAVLSLMPLDQYVATPVTLMRNGEGDPTPPVWKAYEETIARHEKHDMIEYLDRMDFYERAADSYAIVMTGETALYGNIIVKKGVL